MSKRSRQQAILEIVAERRPPNQAALAARLESLGFRVTQATLSRDIAELGLVKSRGGYLRPEDAKGEGDSRISDSRGAVRRLVAKITHAGNLVVVRTAVGGAQTVGVAIDEGGYPGVLGTIAGDDTVLVVAPDDKAAGALAASLGELIA